MPRPKSQLSFFTPPEINALKPAISILREIGAKYSATSTDDQRIIELMDKEFIALCTARNVATLKILSLAKRLSQSKWYCVFVSGVYENADRHDLQPIVQFSLITCEDPKQPKVLTLENSREFYEIEYSSPLPQNKEEHTRYLIQQRKALGLSEEYKLIDLEELEAVLTISELYSDARPSDMPSVKARKMKYAVILLDKLNANIFNMKEQAYELIESGASIPIDVTSKKARKKGKEVSTYLSLDFSAISDELTKRLDPYDESVFNTIISLYHADNSIMSISQIYKNMGYSGIPGKEDRQKIFSSIFKMSGTRIIYQNDEEAEAYHYPKFQGNNGLSFPSIDYLLPVKIIPAVINGKIVDAAIDMSQYGIPPLMKIAADKKQLSRAPQAVLQIPDASKTLGFLAVRNYMLRIICHMKTGTLGKKITYATIAEATNLTTPSQLRYLPKKIDQILTWWSECGWITSYKTTENNDGVEINPKEKKKTVKIQGKKPKNLTA